MDAGSAVFHTGETAGTVIDVTVNHMDDMDIVM
jgi:hypothetical protein